MSIRRYPRLNIYVSDSALRSKIRIAAARAGVTLSEFCLESVRRRLVDEGDLTVPETVDSPRAAAQAMDQLRREIGPIGVRVKDLIDEGRQC